MDKVSVEDLRPIKAFEDVPASQLEWLLANARFFVLPPNEPLFEKGKPADEMLVLLKGRVQIFVQQSGGKKFINTLHAGDITGLLPYSRLKKPSGSGIAIDECHVLALHRDKMPEMIKNHYEMVQSLVHLMTTRVREFTQLQVQNEKLMALGKLSAGLAHELNNPASAIVRSSIALKNHLKALPENFKAVIKIKMTDEDVDKVNQLLFDKINNKPFFPISLMERASKEDTIADWLESKGVASGYEMAENFVDFDFQIEDLEKIMETTTESYFPPVIKWVDDNLTTEKMVDDIQEASKRISDLINSVKSYSYMDKEQDLQKVDLHLGISNTLTILNHKIRKNNIKVSQHYDAEIKEIEGLPGELNQVWTNILDNAIDAMEEKGGELEIRTEKEKGLVKVSILDTGTGIDPEDQTRIFEPFFTTKPMGKGTGLGLDLVRKIISRHNGEIKLNSRPGKTEFQVFLPIKND